MAKINIGSKEFQQLVAEPRNPLFFDLAVEPHNKMALQAWVEAHEKSKQPDKVALLMAKIILSGINALDADELVLLRGRYYIFLNTPYSTSTSYPLTIANAFALAGEYDYLTKNSDERQLGVRYINGTGGDSETIWDYFALGGHLQKLQLAIAAKLCNPNTLNHRGESVWFFFIKGGHFKTAQQAINQGLFNPAALGQTWQNCCWDNIALYADAKLLTSVFEQGLLGLQLPPSSDFWENLALHGNVDALKFAISKGWVKPSAIPSYIWLKATDDNHIILLKTAIIEGWLDFKKAPLFAIELFEKLNNSARVAIAPFFINIPGIDLQRLWSAIDHIHVYLKMLVRVKAEYGNNLINNGVLSHWPELTFAMLSNLIDESKDSTQKIEYNKMMANLLSKTYYQIPMSLRLKDLIIYNLDNFIVEAKDKHEFLNLLNNFGEIIPHDSMIEFIFNKSRDLIIPTIYEMEDQEELSNTLEKLAKFIPEKIDASLANLLFEIITLANMVLDKSSTAYLSLLVPLIRNKNLLADARGGEYASGFMNNQMLAHLIDKNKNGSTAAIIQKYQELATSIEELPPRLSNKKAPVVPSLKNINIEIEIESDKPSKKDRKNKL